MSDLETLLVLINFSSTAHVRSCLFTLIRRLYKQLACEIFSWGHRLMVKANSWMRRNWSPTLSALVWAYCCNRSPVYYDSYFITGRPNLVAYLIACPFWGESRRDEKQRKYKKINCLKIKLFGTCRHWLTLNRKCFQEYFVELPPNLESSDSCSKSPSIY